MIKQTRRNTSVHPHLKYSPNIKNREQKLFNGRLGAPVGQLVKEAKLKAAKPRPEQHQFKTWNRICLISSKTKTLTLDLPPETGKKDGRLSVWGLYNIPQCITKF